jgi:hypothetical protein
MTGVEMCGVFIPDRFRQSSHSANGKVSDWLGVGMLWSGGEVYRACAGRITVLIRWSSLFLEFV